MSGYDLISNMERQLGKRPSPGYVYPMLGELKQKCYISVKIQGRRKVYKITKKGLRLMQQLCNSREQMVNRMHKLLRPITDKQELDSLVEIAGKHGHKHHYIHNLDLIHSIRKSVAKLSSIDDPKLNSDVRKVFEVTEKNLRIIVAKSKGDGK